MLPVHDYARSHDATRSAKAHVRLVCNAARPTWNWRVTISIWICHAGKIHRIKHARADNSPTHMTQSKMHLAIADYSFTHVTQSIMHIAAWSTNTKTTNTHTTFPHTNHNKHKHTYRFSTWTVCNALRSLTSNSKTRRGSRPGPKSGFRDPRQNYGRNRLQDMICNELPRCDWLDAFERCEDRLGPGIYECSADFVIVSIT